MSLIEITPYCSAAEVIRLFGRKAVELRMDDVAEIQDVAITGTPTGGSYTLTYGAASTPAIAFDADQNDVQGALRFIDALPTVEVSTVGVSPNFTHRVTFTSVIGDADILTATNNLSGGSSPTITITTVQAGSDDALDDAITEATEEINKWCYDKYSPAQMARSPLINRFAVRLACYLLSSRRGNPELFEADYERILDQLQMIHSGDLRIPGILLRRALAPVWSNLTTDPRYQYRVIRVQRKTSSRTPRTYRSQVIDYRESYTYEL